MEKKRKVEKEKNSENSGPPLSCQSTAWTTTARAKRKIENILKNVDNFITEDNLKNEDDLRIQSTLQLDIESDGTNPGQYHPGGQKWKCSASTSTST